MPSKEWEDPTASYRRTGLDSEIMEMSHRVGVSSTLQYSNHAQDSFPYCRLWFRKVTV